MICDFVLEYLSALIISRESHNDDQKRALLSTEPLPAFKHTFYISPPHLYRFYHCHIYLRQFGTGHSIYQSDDIGTNIYKCQQLDYLV